MKALIIRAGGQTLCAKLIPALAAMFVVSCPGLLAVEGPIVAVQEALKKQQFYFGESSGVLDEPTRAAVRRLQIRRGLPLTGELDSATMNSLQQAVELPMSVAEVDRQFLAGVQAAREQVSPAAEAVTLPPPIPSALTTVQSKPAAPAASEPSPAVRVKQFAPPPAPPPVTPSVTVSPSPAVARHSELQRDVTAPVRTSAGHPPASAPRVTVETPAKRGASAAVGEASASGFENPKLKRDVQAGRSSEIPEPMQSSERAPVTRSSQLPLRAEGKTRLQGPPRIAEPRTTPARTGIVDSDTEEPMRPQSIRIVRTTTTGADGRIYITERRTPIVSDDRVPIIRRAEPVESRHRDGFFDRIFNDD